MNQKALIGVVVAILLAVGVGAFVINNRSSDNGNTKEGTMMDGKTDASSKKSSLKGLMGLGVNQTCSFSDSESGSEGKVYLGSGKARTDFETVVDDEQTSTHMISDGTTVYMWVEGQGKGYKYVMSDLEKLVPTGSPSVSGTPQKSSVDLNEEVDYTCSAWVVDQSKFTPPTDVEFTDFSTMMQGGALQGETEVETSSDNSQQCSACDSLPEASKAQCLQALGC